MMRQRLLGLTVMLTLAATLCWLMVRDDNQRQTGNLRSEQAAQLFAVNNANTIKTLTVKGPQTTMVLQHDQDGNWFMLQPVQSACDQSMVLGYLQAFLETRIQSRIGGQGKKDDFSKPIAQQDLDLKLFELDKPPYTITLALTDGQQSTLKVGKRNNFDGTLYVTGDHFNFVGMIEGSLSYQLQQEPSELRERRPLVFRPEEIKTIAVADKNGLRFRLERQEADNSFAMTAPLHTRASTAVVDTLLNNLANLHGTDFLAEETKTPAIAHNLGLDKPLYTITLITKTGSEHQLLFAQGQESNQWVASAGLGAHPALSVNSDNLREHLNQDALNIEDKAALTLQPSAIYRIVLIHQDQNLVLQRKKAEKAKTNDTWYVNQDLQALVDSSKVEALLFNITTLKAQQVLARHKEVGELAAFTLEKPEWQVKLYDDNQKELAALRLSATENNKMFLYSSNSQRVDAIDKSSINNWSVAADDYRERVSDKGHPDGSSSP